MWFYWLMKLQKISSENKICVICVIHFHPDMMFYTVVLTLNVRGPSYLGLTRSWSWLLMPWLLTSPGHHQQWYWLYAVYRSLSYSRKDLSTCVISMWRNGIRCKYMFMFTLKNLACKGFMSIEAASHTRITNEICLWLYWHIPLSLGCSQIIWYCNICSFCWVNWCFYIICSVWTAIRSASTFCRVGDLMLRKVNHLCLLLRAVAISTRNACLTLTSRNLVRP